LVLIERGEDPSQGSEKKKFGRILGREWATIEEGAPGTKGKKTVVTRRNKRRMVSERDFR